MPEVDLSGITDEQKSAIIVAAAQPYLGVYRGLDQVSTAGDQTMLAVYQAGVAAGTRAFGEKLGAPASKTPTAANGSIAEQFDADFDRIVAGAGLLRDGGTFRAPQADSTATETTVQPEVPQTGAVPVTPVVTPTVPATPTTGGQPASSPTGATIPPTPSPEPAS